MAPVNPKTNVFGEFVNTLTEIKVLIHNLNKYLEKPDSHKVATAVPAGKKHDPQ